MGKTRDPLKKTRDTKGTFNTKMGPIKNRNGMDVAEAENIKKWQEYTEEPYKKDFHDPDNHNGVITHLEPDIVEFKVTWALGSITMNKASQGDGIQLSYVKSLRRCYETDSLNMPANSENSAVATGLEMITFHSSPKKGQCQRIFKLLHICAHLTH